MADLGTDAGQATLNLSAKLLELLAKILDKIFEYIQKRPERQKAKNEAEVAKLKAAVLRPEAERAKAIEKIEGKAGYIKFQDMKATGKEMINTEVEMTSDEMKLFSDIAKRYDLTFTGLQLKDSDTRELFIFREDLAKFERVHARFANEVLLNEIQEKLDKYDEVGYENLSAEDKETYDGLKAQKEHIIDGITEQFNEETNESVIKDAVLDEEGNLKKMDLEEALNRLTGYNLSNPDSGDFIIADASNPANYIKVHGFNDSFENEEGKKIDYVRSQYEVYKNNEHVGSFDDRRYVGRPKGYWKNIREQMRDSLGNPQYLFKFKTEEAHKEWAKDVTRQNEQELNNVSIESLKKELQDKGFGYENGNAILKHAEVAQDGTVIPVGQAIDKDFIIDIVGKSNAFTTHEQRLDFLEAFYATEMIDSLENSSKLEEQMGLKNAEIVVEDDPERQVALQNEYAALEEQLNKEKENIEGIKDYRKRINACQAERNVAKNKERNREEDIEKDPVSEEKEYFGQQQTMEEIQNDIKNERVAQDMADVKDSAKAKAPKMHTEDVAKDAKTSEVVR